MSTPFGCPHCGQQRPSRRSTRSSPSTPVTQWNEEGEPAKYGDPSYGNSFRVDEDPYICLTCRDNGDECSFSEPARLPLQVDGG